MTLPTRALITAVRVRLERGDAAALAASVADAKARRDRHQPKGRPNAGSIFKNPPGTFAGRLLEEAGLKGARLGDAMFSERHANFIVNLGHARAVDVKGLIDLATRAVRRLRAIELEPEVRLVGEVPTGLAGKRVLLVDGIVDTGRSLAAAAALLRQGGVGELRTCVLLDKPQRRGLGIAVDFVGFSIGDVFVVGYGTDHAEQYRYLPHIAIVE